MSANGHHAGLVVLVVLSFCTFGRCAVLTFERSENIITLRCVSDLENQFPIPNAIFFVRTPDSSRQRVGPRNNEITFTLTPETEGNFSCQNPTTNEFSAGLLLAGEEYKMWPSLIECIPNAYWVQESMPLFYFAVYWNNQKSLSPNCYHTCILTNPDFWCSVFQLICLLCVRPTENPYTVYSYTFYYFLSCSIPRYWPITTNTVHV